MKYLYSSVFLLLSATVCFSQQGLTLQKIDNKNKTSVIPNGTKIAVILTDGTRIKGILDNEDANTLRINHGATASIINYASVKRITTFKETEYFAVTGDMFDGIGEGDWGNCGSGCGNGCGNVGSGPAVLCAVAVVAGVCVGIVATELIVEGTADLLNDNYYSMDIWQFASAN